VQHDDGRGYPAADERPECPSADAAREIEAIKQLKARYFRTMDAKDYGEAEGTWRIATSRLTRLRTDFTGPSDG
jgi:hypothetical protein